MRSTALTRARGLFGLAALAMIFLPPISTLVLANEAHAIGKQRRQSPRGFARVRAPKFCRTLTLNHRHWTAERDSETRALRALTGNHPLPRGSDLEAVAPRILTCNARMLRLEPDEFQLESSRRLATRTPRTIIRFVQRRGEAILEGRGVTLRFTGEALTGMSLNVAPSSRTPVARIDAETAIDIAHRMLAVPIGNAEAEAEMRLFENDGLAWRVDLPTHQGRALRVRVDAQGGEILRVINRAHADVSGTVTGPTVGNGTQSFNDQRIHFSTALPGGAVVAAPFFSETWSDAMPGSYQLETFVGSKLWTVEAGLNGHYARVNSMSSILAEGTPNAWFQTQVNPSQTLNWDWSTADPSTDFEQSNVYWHINNAHRFFTRGDVWDVHELDYEMEIQVDMPNQLNLDLVCNGQWNPQLMGIQMTGENTIHINEETGEESACPQFGLSPHGLYHEYTHAVQHFTASNINYSDAQGCAVTEGLADYFGATILDQPAGLENSKRYPEDFLTYDTLDNGCHSNSDIIGGVVWDL